MNYTVLWRQLAESELAKMWARAANPEAVADAADAANRLLRDLADELGESRDRAARRIWFQRPLCLLYEIDAIAKGVRVAAVKWVGH